jgi:hypothetical protein
MAVTTNKLSRHQQAGGEKIHQHNDPIDKFWMIGGHPYSKLKEIERNWQKDMSLLLKAREDEYDMKLKSLSEDLNNSIHAEKQMKQIYQVQNEE